MILSEQTKRQLQGLMSDERWAAVEQALGIYLKEKFVESSIKRDTEFNTMWYAAEAEGGKTHLQNFFSEMEEQAQQTHD